MSNKNLFFNLLGQIRIYSLVDFLLLLIAIKSDKYQIAGAVLLHLGFLLFLETAHNHKYRKSFPKYSWLILTLAGLVFLHNLAVFLFLIFSFLYTRKNKAFLGYFSPIARGLQIYFIVAAVDGFSSHVAFLAFGLIVLRNFAGDLRDVEKDKKEGLRTLPIALVLKKDIKSAHFIMLILTSIVWWALADISIVWLLLVFALEILTYNITPR